MNEYPFLRDDFAFLTVIVVKKGINARWKTKISHFSSLPPLAPMGQPTPKKPMNNQK
jgi:hypothetical protein